MEPDFQISIRKRRIIALSDRGKEYMAGKLAAVAHCLERALPDVPDHDALVDKAFEDPRLPGVRLIRADTTVNAIEWFSGREKKRLLKRFIRYCRQGGFEIW